LPAHQCHGLLQPSDRLSQFCTVQQEAVVPATGFPLRGPQPESCVLAHPAQIGVKGSYQSLEGRLEAKLGIVDPLDFLQTGQQFVVVNRVVEDRDNSLSVGHSMSDFLPAHPGAEGVGADNGFVSVTQQFNTATPVGRLTLHILLSFAEFEREIISERTRDNKSAARRKGKWTGGYLPLGYDLEAGGGRLAVNAEEAARVRAMFGLFVEKRSLADTLEELRRRGWTTKSWKTGQGKEHRGRAFTEGSLTRLLGNDLYTGRIRYQGKRYRGEHTAIVEERLWKRTQRFLDSLPPAFAQGAQ